MLKVLPFRQKNRNHFICKVEEKINGCKEIYSVYFDGTQAQAIEHFLKHPRIRRYLKNSDYDVSMRSNSISFDRTMGIF